MKRLITATMILFATPVWAQDSTVTQKDWGQLQKILTEDIPAKWAQPVMRWAQEIIQREASKSESKEPKSIQVEPKKDEKK